MPFKLETLFYFGYKTALHSIVFSNRKSRNILKNNVLQNRVFANLLLFHGKVMLFLSVFIVILIVLWENKFYFRYKKWKRFWSLLNSILKANPNTPNVHPYKIAHTRALGNYFQVIISYVIGGVLGHLCGYAFPSIPGSLPPAGIAPPYG